MQIKLGTYPTPPNNPNPWHYFYAISSYAEKDALKSAGFRWHADSKTWRTDDEYVAARFADACDADALALLKKRRVITDEQFTELEANSFKNSKKADAQEKVQHDAETISHEEIQAVHQMLRSLANACDGAETIDGFGFNKQDAHFGKELAARPQLSPRQAAWGKKIVYKYQKQLDADLFALVFAKEVAAQIEKKEIKAEAKRCEKREQKAQQIVDSVDELIVETCEHGGRAFDVYDNKTAKKKNARNRVFRLKANCKVHCTCFDYAEQCLQKGDENFRCEHILAVKEYLLKKQNESAAVGPAVAADAASENVTCSLEAQAEQKAICSRCNAYKMPSGYCSRCGGYDSPNTLRGIALESQEDVSQALNRTEGRSSQERKPEAEVDVFDSSLAWVNLQPVAKHENQLDASEREGKSCEASTAVVDVNSIFNAKPPINSACPALWARIHEMQEKLRLEDSERTRTNLVQETLVLTQDIIKQETKKGNRIEWV